jgi:hypothetical protein
MTMCHNIYVCEKSITFFNKIIWKWYDIVNFLDAMEDGYDN